MKQSKKRNGPQAAVFHNKKKERSARRKQIKRATEELAKERREREAVDKGDRKGHKQQNGHIETFCSLVGFC
jgi:hypothetical protein